MLSKFFPALKPKEYSVQILNDSTSQSAVKRIKRTRTGTPLKKIASLALVLSFIGGGLVSATAATAVTAEQAQANIFADMVCIKSGDDSGAWNGGANRYGPIGGRAQYSMDNVGKKTAPSDAAYGGRAGDWGSNAPEGGKALTAYEKYGMLYPVYDSWVPVYTEKADKITIKQIDSHSPTGTYSTADGKLTTKDGNELEAGASPLTTSDIGACMAFMPAVSAGIANMIAVLPRFVMGASIELYSTAYGSSLSQPDSVLYGIGKAIDKFITQSGGLKDTLFIGFMMPLLMIGAAVVGWAGIVKKKTTEALQSTLWMVIAIALGSVFLAQPSLVSSYVDNTVYEVQRVVNGSVLDSSQSNDMCNLTGSNDSKKVLRETKCTIWHSTIYSTWVAGQFGEGANSSRGGSSVLTQEAGRDILGNGLYTIQYGSDSKNWKTAQTWPQFMVDRQVTHKSLELSEVAWAQLSGANGAKINSDWAGSIGMISSAVLMFFGAGASSAVLFVYGFTLLIYQLMMISAVFMSPFFFLFGIVPNWGRRVLMRYAELLASLAVKRIVTGTLLAFYLLFYNLIVGDGEASVDMLLLKIIIIFALAIFFIGQRAKFVNMFAGNINFGGDKSIGLPGNKAAALTAGIGVGLLGGGLIGGAIATSKIRKNNKDMEGDLQNMSFAGAGGSPTADIKNPPRGPNSGGDSKGGTNPVAAVSKGVRTVKDVSDLADKAGQAKKFFESKTGAQSASNAPSGGIPTNTPPVAPQGASAASGGASSAAAGSSASAGAAGTAASGGSAAAVGGAGAGAKAAGLAGRMAGMAGSGGGAGAAVAPAGAAAAGSSGVAAGGAAAAGSAGVAAGGAAAAGSAGVAAGGAAAAGGAGAVAAGAAAGSVVPVVGTAIGAAAGAAVVAAAAKKKKAAENGGD